MTMGEKLVNLRDLKRAKEIIDSNTSATKVSKITPTPSSDVVYAKKEKGLQSSLGIASKIETYDYLVGNVIYIYKNIINGTITGNDYIHRGEVITLLTIKPAEGYMCPVTLADLEVVNATLENYDRNTGELTLINPTNTVYINATCPEIKTIYTITSDITLGYAVGDIEILQDGSATVCIISDDGYLPPEESSINVINANIKSYNRDSGILVIENPTDNVIIALTCEPKTYSISGNITKGSLIGSTTITHGETAIVEIVACEGYNLPTSSSSITITNAILDSYDPETGILNISDPVGDVTITATCNIIVYSIEGNITNGILTGSSAVVYEGTATVIIQPYEGYNLPADVSDITVLDATIASYDNTTGKLVIYNPTNDVRIMATCEYKPEPLTFEALTAPVIIKYQIIGSITGLNIEASYDAVNWFSWDGSGIALAVVGRKLYVRNTVNKLSTDTNHYLQFIISGVGGRDGKVAASGNVNSLINYGALSHSCFYRLFADCTSLVSAPELPATELITECYREMFNNTGITKAPELPAETLANWCYNAMFENCGELTEASDLPAKVIAAQSYSYMYAKCAKLIKPALMADGEQITSIDTYGCTAMYRVCSTLKVSNTGSESGSTQFMTLPASVGASALVNMFDYTGGSFVGTPVVNGTYYYY